MGDVGFISLLLWNCSNYEAISRHYGDMKQRVSRHSPCWKDL